jgi:hypothetical protein
MSVAKRISLLALLVLGVVLAGCGGDKEGKPLPAAQVQLLNGRLDEAERRLADGSEGACKDILDDTQPEVGRIIDSLPDDVDADVRDALTESFDNLWNVVDDRCQEIADQSKPEPTKTEPETDTETDTTETEPETDTETDTTTTTTTEPDTAPLPNDGNGNGNGNDGIPGTGNGGGVSPGALDEGAAE